VSVSRVAVRECRLTRGAGPDLEAIPQFARRAHPGGPFAAKQSSPVGSIGGADHVRSSTLSSEDPPRNPAAAFRARRIDPARRGCARRLPGGGIPGFGRGEFTPGLGRRNFDRCHQLGADCRQFAGKTGRETAHVLGNRQRPAVWAAFPRCVGGPGRVHPQPHQSREFSGGADRRRTGLLSTTCTAALPLSERYVRGAELLRRGTLARDA